MKRKDLERHLRDHGCVLHHHGGRHDVWLNPANLNKAPVPRHQEIKKGTVLGVCRIWGFRNHRAYNDAVMQVSSGESLLRTALPELAICPQVRVARINCFKVSKTRAGKLPVAPGTRYLEWFWMKTG